MSPVRLELTADPGQRISSQFVLTNEEQSTKTFYITAQNFFAKDETGTPSFSPKKDGLASWIKLPDSITLGPKEQQHLEYSIGVPGDTEPGGYSAGIFASTLPPEEQENGTVSIASQVGTLLLLRVSGVITEGVDILELNTENKKKVFTSLPIEFYYRFQNSGQSWVKPLGDVKITNTFGQTTKIISANSDGSNVLPKSIRRFAFAWLSNSGNEIQDPKASHPPEPPNGFWNKVKHEWRYFALGRYTVNLSLTYNNDTSTTTHAKTSFWVLPWHFLVVAIPTIIIVLILLRISIKRYNRHIIRKAQGQKRK